MRKYVVIFGALMLFAAAAAYAGFVGNRTYYSDAAQTNATGGEWVNCNGTTNWQWGSPANYRRFEGLFCPSAYDVVICQQWNGTSWVNYECPWY